MVKRLGIDWAGINDHVGAHIPIHPLSLVADWIYDNPSDSEDEIWNAALLLMDRTTYVSGAEILEELTSIHKIVWMHLVIIWLARDQ